MPKFFLHFISIYFVASSLVLADLFLSLSSNLFSNPDEYRLHYLAGRLGGAFHFMCVFFLLLIKFLITDLKESIVKFIIKLFYLLIILAILVLIIFAIDYFIEIPFLTSLQLDVFVKGGFSMMPVIGVVMMFTPLALPAGSLQHIGEMFNKKKSTGQYKLDAYLHAKESAENVLDPEVLLIEDDISCATSVLRFCKKLDLRCMHVKSIAKAEAAFDEHKHTIRLIIVDNFVRTEHSRMNCSTGIEWAQHLKDELPEELRTFKIVMMTGHPELVKDSENVVDLLMAKPWDPKVLLDFIKEEQIV